MSVVVSVVAPGLNAEMYEAVTGRVMPGDQLHDGCELHIAGPVEQGWRVITCGSRARPSTGFVRESCFQRSESSPGRSTPRWRNRRSTRSTRTARQY
jgi:hypothetical protein